MKKQLRILSKNIRQKHLKFSLLSSVVLTAGVGCNSGISNQASTTSTTNSSVTVSNTNHAKKLQSADIIRPGRGFSSFTDSVAPDTCYKVQMKPNSSMEPDVNYGDIIGTAHFDTSINSQDALLERQASVSASYKGLEFGTDFSTKYLMSHTEDRLSLTFNFYHKFTRMVEPVYGHGADMILNDTGKAIYAEKNPTNFKIKCGDRVISKYREAGILWVTYKVNFTSEKDKTRFEASLGGSYSDKLPNGKELSAATFNSTISQLAAADNINLTITADAKQFGGTPEDLGQAVTHASTGCSSDNLYNCNSFFQGIASYAQTFGNQFMPVNNDYSNVRMNFDNYLETRPVADLGLTFESNGVQLPPEIAEMRDKLNGAYQKNLYYLATISRIRNDYPLIDTQLDWKFKQLIESTTTILNENNNILSEGVVDQCWSDSLNNESDCLTKGKDLLSKLQFPTNDIEKIKDTLHNALYIPAFNVTLFPTGKAEASDSLMYDVPEAPIPSMSSNVNGNLTRVITKISSFRSVKRDAESSTENHDGQIAGDFIEVGGCGVGKFLINHAHLKSDDGEWRQVNTICDNGVENDGWIEVHKIDKDTIPKNPYDFDLYNPEKMNFNSNLK